MNIYKSLIREEHISNNEIEYQIQCENGDVHIHCICVFPGVEVIYNHIQTFTSPELHKKTRSMIEINHCRKGKFECVFDNQLYGYLSEGDLGINSWNIDFKTSGFPLGYYEGVEVLLDVELAKECALFHILHIDIEALRRRVNQNKNLFIMRSTQQIEHIFSEIYEVNQKTNIDYLRIKVAELLLFLSQVDFEMIQTHNAYYSQKQIECVKHIKEHLVEDLSQKYDFEKLAMEHHINIYTLRKCFKDIYGKPIYRWYKEYRIQYAAKLLKETNLPIIEIAAQVGYDNPSKFSSSFYQLMGKRPILYRKENQK